jgi:HlyD family secretion protein
MIRTFLIPVLAILGVLFGVYTVVKGSRPPAASPPVIEPPRAPFTSFVAGSGMIETSTQNIAIGTPVAGVAIKLAVVVGDQVAKGDVLFVIDSRDLAAEHKVRAAALAVAQAKLEVLRSSPRKEEVPPAEARVAEAQSLLSDAENQLERWRKVNDPRAVSEDELSRRRYAVETAKTRVAEAVASLELLKAGAWAPDLAVAEAEVASALAALDSINTELERRIIRAPVDGQVLQVNLRVGEFAQAGPLTTPLMMMGSVSPLHVRVDIDEHDAWRVKMGAQATAFVRGNNALKTPLSFVRFEPYVVPKRSLTGESTERVDTRVLQVLYAFDRKDMPVFVGQQMDVYIEAPSLDSLMGKQQGSETPPGSSASQQPAAKAQSKTGSK